MAFEVGQEIGGYEFIEVLEASGTGITYRVRNPLAQRFEALKILSKDLQADRERVERFLREVKIHARLSHPNIAAFYSALEIEGQLVMTTELATGSTLEQLIEGGPLPLARALEYADQVLSALEYAHQNGVIHRNIAPASIVITEAGVAKLTEFGLAKAVTDPRLTHTGLVMGSMHYLSPEQVQGLPVIDARTDIYSFSLVLFEMVTGRKPFDSKSQFDVMQAHVQLPPPPPRKFRPDLPPAVEDAILRALWKNPDDRFQTAQAFRDALRGSPPDVAAGTSAFDTSGETAARSSGAPLPPELVEAAGTKAAPPTAAAQSPAQPATTSNAPEPQPADPRLLDDALSEQARVSDQQAGPKSSPVAPASAPWESPFADQRRRRSSQAPPSAEPPTAIDPMVVGIIAFVASGCLLLLAVLFWT